MRGLQAILPFLVLSSLIASVLLIPQNASSTGWSGTGSLPVEMDNYWYIDNEIKITTKQEFTNGNIIINSTGKLIIQENGDLFLKNVNIGFNTTGNGTPTIHVLKGGKLEMTNLTAEYLYSPDNELKYKITIDLGAILNLTNCNFYSKSLLKNPQFIIYSSNIQIQNCKFAHDFIGLLLQNISNISIINCEFLGANHGLRLIGTQYIILKNCTFSTGNYGVEIIESENISFNRCIFSSQEESSCKLVNSGKKMSIKFTNCTIAKSLTPNQQKSLLGFELENSKLIITNQTLQNIHPINKSWDLDENSEINMFHYLNLLTVDSKEKPLGSVDIVITDNTSASVFSGITNEQGRLGWIVLQTKKILKNETIIYNPFKIVATKNKDDYKSTTYISLITGNSGKYQKVELTKKKKDSEDDWQNSILLICVCVMVVITVFILMLSINLYLARKKAGLDKINGIIFKDDVQRKGAGDQRTVVDGKELITCSECGTMVTEDASFCPHCGEYFEGEEFRCPGCDTKLREKDSSCPKCGRIFEDKTEKKSDTKTKKNAGKRTGKLFCSECSAVIDENDTSCPGCGLEFKEKTHKEDGKKYKSMDEEIPNGKKEFAHKLTEEEEAEVQEKKENLDESEDVYMCSICGATVGESSKKCPKCGTELE
jgi:RNA polymerase subunit RPABC4/transcription elongation factor Spt4